MVHFLPWRVRVQLARCLGNARSLATQAGVHLMWRRRWAKRRRHGLPQRLVVSLTSYPKRFPTIAPTLKCLLAQDVAPDHLILWIGHGLTAKLPRDVLVLQEFGLDIRETDDIGPFTKIIPSLEAFPHAFVATADDDLYYRPDWLRQMTAAFNPAAPAIICHRAHRIRLNEHGAPLPYWDWDMEVASPETSALLFPTGVGGVLYFPGALPPATLNRTQFQALSQHSDDMWLYWMERNAGVLITTLGFKQTLLFWNGSQDVGLFNTNVIGIQRNDIYIKNLYDAYGLLT